jgi:hypothetical protein
MLLVILAILILLVVAPALVVAGLITAVAVWLGLGLHAHRPFSPGEVQTELQQIRDTVSSKFKREETNDG